MDETNQPAPTSRDIDQMIAELQAAGWTPKAPTIWKSPGGALYLGPVGAWRRMKGLSARDRHDDESGRTALIQRACALRADIEQVFLDLAHWNDHVRKPSEAPIDPDPDGQLRRIANGLDRMLAAEAQR